MQYTFMKSNQNTAAAKSEATLYIIPLSADDQNYGIIYPRDLQKNLLNKDYLKGLSLRHFRGCSGKAIAEVKENLSTWLKKSIRKKVKAIENSRIMGICLIFIGIFDLFFPDPLIMLDELLMLAGGLFLLSHWTVARKELRNLMLLEQAIDAEVKKIYVREDALCTTILKAIQAKADLEQTEPENESRWLEVYLEIEDILQADPRRRQDLQSIYEGVMSIIPLKQYHKLEKKIKNRMGKRKSIHFYLKRRKKISSLINQQSGLSDDALEVYHTITGTLEQFKE